MYNTTLRSLQLLLLLHMLLWKFKDLCFLQVRILLQISGFRIELILHMLLLLHSILMFMLLLMQLFLLLLILLLLLLELILQLLLILMLLHLFLLLLQQPLILLILLLLLLLLLMLLLLQIVHLLLLLIIFLQFLNGFHLQLFVATEKERDLDSPNLIIGFSASILNVIPADPVKLMRK